MERLYRYVVKGGAENDPVFLFQTNDVDELVLKIKEYASKKVAKQYYWRILDYDNYVMIDYVHVYIVGNVYAYLPGIFRNYYKKPYIEEMVAFPFSFSLFHSIFFKN